MTVKKNVNLRVSFIPINLRPKLKGQFIDPVCIHDSSKEKGEIFLFFEDKNKKVNPEDFLAD